MVHLRKQLIIVEITDQEKHGQCAGPESRATLSSGQEINTPLPKLSGVTVVSAAMIVLLNRRRKHPIRLRLENNLRGAFILVQERWSRGEGKKEEGDSRRDKQRGEGMEVKQDVLGFYLLPHPLSRSNSYLQ